METVIITENYVTGIVNEITGLEEIGDFTFTEIYVSGNVIKFTIIINDPEALADFINIYKYELHKVKFL